MLFHRKTLTSTKYGTYAFYFCDIIYLTFVSVNLCNLIAEKNVHSLFQIVDSVSKIIIIFI